MEEEEEEEEEEEAGVAASPFSALLARTQFARVCSTQSVQGRDQRNSASVCCWLVLVASGRGEEREQRGEERGQRGEERGERGEGETKRHQEDKEKRTGRWLEYRLGFCAVPCRLVNAEYGCSAASPCCVAFAAGFPRSWSSCDFRPQLLAALADLALAVPRPSSPNEGSPNPEEAEERPPSPL